VNLRQILPQMAALWRIFGLGAGLTRNHGGAFRKMSLMQHRAAKFDIDLRPLTVPNGDVMHLLCTIKKLRHGKGPLARQTGRELRPFSAESPRVFGDHQLK